METLYLLGREDRRLAQKASAIENILDPAFQAWIDSLIRCGQEQDGVGIAAPQVGKSIRLFIMAPNPNPRYPDAPTMAPTAIINPVIVHVSTEMEKGWEGCLSVPGFRGLVPRHCEIEVQYLDRMGQSHSAHFTGFLARLFQHEFDHLEGILYPERMIDGDPLVTLVEFTAITGIVIPA
jgi:peptide deformylase